MLASFPRENVVVCAQYLIDGLPLWVDRYAYPASWAAWSADSTVIFDRRASAGVTCRRWNWRQARRTQLSDDTTAAPFIVAALDPVAGGHSTPPPTTWSPTWPGSDPASGRPPPDSRRPGAR